MKCQILFPEFAHRLVKKIGRNMKQEPISYMRIMKRRLARAFTRYVLYCIFFSNVFLDEKKKNRA